MTKPTETSRILPYVWLDVNNSLLQLKQLFSKFVISILSETTNKSKENSHFFPAKLDRKFQPMLAFNIKKTFCKNSSNLFNLHKKQNNTPGTSSAKKRFRGPKTGTKMISISEALEIQNLKVSDVLSNLPAGRSLLFPIPAILHSDILKLLGNLVLPQKLLKLLY